jgi:prepilin-type processing-associated H-X9-DG protein
MTEQPSAYPAVPGCTIESLAGRGGMGAVYRARRGDDAQPIAVKVLHAGDPALRARLQSEFRILSRLEHPALVRMQDFGYLDDGRPFFIMDWVEGIPLSPAALRDREGELDERRFATLVYDLTAALAYIHSQHVTHGDLKPANILMADGHPRIMDFGLSVLQEAAAGDGSAGGGISGTIEYLAPERIRGEEAAPSSDLYALGCILHELATGTPPYQGGTAIDVLRGHLREDVPPPPTALPAVFGEWIRTLLQKQPQLRYRGARQLHDAAAAYLGVPPAQLTDTAAGSLRLLDIPRRQEHARAREAWEQSRERTRMLVIEGPEGIGKTRFLRERSADIQFAGGRLLRVELRAGESPFASFLRVFAAHAAASAADGGESAPQLALIATWFPDAFPGVAAAPRDGLQTESLRLRTLHAAVELLCLGLAPDAVLIDNLHLADEFTRDFLVYTLSWADANAHAGLLLLAARDAAADTGEEPPASPLRETLRLPALTKPEIGESLAALLGGVSPSFTEVIARQSKGIPGRVEELLNFCVAERILEATDHGWLVHERENLGAMFPATMTQLYARAIARLGDEAYRALAAIVASPVPCASDAVSAASGLDAVALRAAVAELVHAELIEARSDPLAPAHDAVREAMREALRESPRASADPQSLHAAWYAWYAAHPPRHDADAVLAHHALASGDTARALPHLLDAARYREARFDSAGAEAMLHAALPLIDENDTERRFHVLDGLSRLSNILGRRAAEEEFLEEMLLLAAQSNSTARLAAVYRNQTEHYLSVAEYDRARRSAEKALACFGDTGDALGQAWCHQKIGFSEYRTRPGEHVLTHYEQARGLFRGADADAEEGGILIDIGLVYYSVLENPERALACFEEARAIFERVGDRRGLTRAFGNMGAQYYALGRYEDAMEYHGRANALAIASGDRRLIATSYGALGQCGIALCRYSPALLHLQEELRIAREIDDAYLQEMCFENLGVLYKDLGAYDKAMDAIKAGQRLAEQSGNTAGLAAGHIDLAGCLIEKREFDAAQSALNKAAALLDEAQDVNVTAMLHWRNGYLQLMRGDADALERALRHLNQFGDLADRHGFDSYRILARSYAGIAQLRLGRHSVALELSTEAVALLEELGPLYGGSHDILFNHGLILRANKEAAGAADFITRAHEAMMRNAESIADAQLYRSYLEQVAVHADIAREFARTHRDQSPQTLTAVREQNLRTLYGVASKINSVLDLDQLLDTIMDSALETMSGERGLIFLIENEQLVLKVSRNVEKETIRDATEISLSILRDVLHAGRPIIVSDTAQSDEYKRRESVVNFHIHSLICVPMKSRDRIIGTVYVDSRSDAIAAMSFTEIDAEFLEAFANLATMAIENARLHAELKKENLYLRREVAERFGFENIIGASKPMDTLFAETQAAIGSEGSVLIYGESGTGKELIAKAIHYNGARREHRFVAVDCGALPDTLLESELFGYKRGAFTGAVTDKPGLFEEAHNGTLFLDEISNTSLAFQAKLLRVLQEGEFRRVGDAKTRIANVRVICATNKDLAKEIETERFRQDLFYRLNVIPITVPPLRSRISDIPLLVEHFIAKYNQRHASPVRSASTDLVEYLQRLPWNGNVRELENLINRMIAQSQEEMLTLRMLPSDYAGAQKTTDATERGDFELSLKAPRRLDSLENVEKEHIAFVLKHTDGNKTEAAKILGLKRTTLVEKMKKLGMM